MIHSDSSVLVSKFLVINILLGLLCFDDVMVQEQGLAFEQFVSEHTLNWLGLCLFSYAMQLSEILIKFYEKHA